MNARSVFSAVGAAISDELSAGTACDDLWLRKLRAVQELAAGYAWRAERGMDVSGQERGIRWKVALGMRTKREANAIVRRLKKVGADNFDVHDNNFSPRTEAENKHLLSGRQQEHLGWCVVASFPVSLGPKVLEAVGKHAHDQKRWANRSLLPKMFRDERNGTGSQDD